MFFVEAIPVNVAEKQVMEERYNIPTLSGMRIPVFILMGSGTGSDLDRRIMRTRVRLMSLGGRYT